MRKVKFTVNGNEHEGYFIGISPYQAHENNRGVRSWLIVEDLDGNVYTVADSDVKMQGKPPHNSEPVLIDLRVVKSIMSSGVKNNEGENLSEAATEVMNFLINLADRNIGIVDTTE